jgi:hypothetical protein
LGQVEKKRLRSIAVQKTGRDKSYVSLRNIKQSVERSRILMTPKLNFLNSPGNKLLPEENKERKERKQNTPCPAPIHTQMLTHVA